MNQTPEQNAGLASEQVEQVFTNFVVGIEILFDEHAVLRARMVIETVKREFGIDLAEKNPNAEALLAAFHRRQLDKMLTKATEQFVQTYQ